MKVVKSMLFLSVLMAVLVSCASVEVRAAKKGDIESLQEFLDKGGDVNESQRGGITLLMYASEAGQIQAINFLLDRGALINLKDNNGRTAFIYAVIPGKQSAAELLLQRGADMNTILPSGDNALTLSAAARNRAMITMLLNKGADPNHKNNKGWSSLTLSLSRDAQSASGIGQISTIFINLDASIDVDSDNVSKIALTAASSGNKEVLQYLFNLGYDIEKVTASGETLLFAAATAQKPEMVRFLLEMGADWSFRNPQGWTALMKSLNDSAAAGTGPNSIARVLIEKGAHPEGNSPQGQETAFKASKTGATEILDILFDHGLSSQVKDSKGNNLLHIGAAHSDVVSLLIAQGVAVDGRNNQKMTPLIQAAAGNSGASLTVLLQAGAEADLKDKKGQTALFYAAASPDVEMVRALLIAGASHFMTDSTGNTALHRAAAGGIPETVRLLLTAGIFVDSANAAGETPYNLSFKNGTHGDAIRKILVQAGAKVPEVVVTETVTQPDQNVSTPVKAEDVSKPNPKPVPIPVLIADQAAEEKKQTPVESETAEETTAVQTPVESETSEETTAVQTPDEPEPKEEVVVVPTPVQPDLTVRFGWPAINPSKVKGWNNSDKLTGQATIQIAYSSDNQWFYEYTMDIPRRGVNADRYEADLDFGSKELDQCKAVLTLPTKKGKALVSEIQARPDLEGRMILYFNQFQYK